MGYTVTLMPIGTVRSRAKENTPSEELRPHQSQIIIKPEFEPGLTGLTAGQDVQVLFFFSQIEPDEIELQLHPRHNPENPKRGVFATRSQFRPNRIGSTVAQIVAIEGNVVTVTGLDALDQTPVLDIKPYAPYFDTETREQRFEVCEVSDIQQARAGIDIIDAEIVRLLGNRAGYVRQVVRFKKRPEDVPAPMRYAQVMAERRKMAETHGLNPDVIEGMYKLLVDNFIEEEIEIIKRRALSGPENPGPHGE